MTIHFGVRVEKSGWRMYWTGMGTEPLAETDLTGVDKKEYIYFAGKRIAFLDVSTGNRYYYYSDDLGSANVITNGSGSSIQAESDFYPFGGERVITNLINNRYKFTGQENDPESGLNHFLFRDNSPVLGRFMSPDLLAGDVGNPQSLNRYAYVGNNPTSFVDPLGLESDCIALQYAWVDGELDSVTLIDVPCPGAGAGGGGGGRDDVGGGGGGGGGGAGGNPAPTPSQTPANNFTLGLRQPGQTFNQCMQANAGNYSLLGVVDFATGANGQIADNVALGFTPASNTITSIYNAAAGSLTSLLQTGPTVVTAGTGTVLTSGRRTSSIMSLNLPGTPGGSASGAPALGSAPSNAARAGKAAASALKIAIDAGFFLAEGAGCAGPMNY